MLDKDPTIRNPHIEDIFQFKQIHHYDWEKGSAMGMRMRLKAPLNFV